MQRKGRASGVAVALALATWMPAAGAQTTTTDTTTTTAGGDELSAIVDDALVNVAEKAAVLDALEAFSEPTHPPLQQVIAAVDWGTSQTRDELIGELTRRERDAEDILADLKDEVGLSFEVAETLEGPREDEWSRIEDGDTAFIDGGPYLSALDDLVQRDGRSPEGGIRSRIEAHTLVEAYLQVVGGVLPGPPATAGPSGPPATAGGPGPPATAGTPGTTTAEDDAASNPIGADSPWALVVGVLVLGALGAALVALRRRAPGDGGARYDELLEVSRSLASARTTADVERIAAAEAARLLGGEGVVTGAVVHRSAMGLELGHETLDGVLVPDRLGDGLLRRVVETGQTIASVVDHEPALRALPSSLVAVPIIGGGRIEGVLLAVRTPDQPFTPEDVELLGKLGPIAAAALDSARHTDESAEASLTDALTDVGNRRKLERDVPALLKGATDATALVMVDLDHFKAVNDTHGHPVGDAVLRGVAAVLRSAMRPGDGVYRYGGEEFALVLPATSEDAAVIAAERAREALVAAEIDAGDGVVLRMTASMGVAATTGPDDDVDALGLIARADRALYAAKERGRDLVVAASTLTP